MDGYRRRGSEYGISGILRPKKKTKIIQLKEKTKARRAPIRRESSVFDVMEHINK